MKAFANLYSGVTGRTFSSLAYRNYRLLWTGNLISQTGDWMDQIAFNWLVLELTGSPLYLGLVNLCRAVPILLFTLMGGVAADRMERRKLLMVTQSFAMLLAFILAALVSFGSVQIWQIMIIAALRGTMMSFNLPARQTLISDLVPRHSLANAIAINSMTTNLTRVIGPAIAGILIGVAGVAGCFYINGLSFLAVLWMLHRMDIPPLAQKPVVSGVLKSFKEGLGYVRDQHTMALLIIIALVPLFFGNPYMTMLTVFARDVLSIGPTGLGLLTGAASLGSVIGALVVASLPHSPVKSRIMPLALVMFGIFLVSFSYSAWVPLAALLLVGVGAAQTSYSASNNSLLQSSVPDEFRGRVLSMLFLQRGLVPLGTALAGALATLIGVRLAIASMGSIIVLLGIVAATMMPRVRQLELDVYQEYSAQGDVE